MQLLVNDQPSSIAISAQSTVRDLARVVCPPDGSNRCIVVSVRCDGRDIPSGELEAILNNPANTFHELAFQTQPLKALVSQSLRDASLLIESADAARSEAADLIAQGREQAAFTVLAKLFGDWRQAQEVFALCTTAVRSDALDGGSAACSAQLINRMRQQLTELKAALEARDLVLVGDILTFELPDHLSEWKAALQALHQEAVHQ